MANEEQTPYRVLARKYRPQNFDQLIGQDALVRTLKNAIQSGRIAHAFMLTGVRGVGKTTTARIIAKALNYTGPDGKAGPTTGPTDDCEICKAIAADRHPDVLEMDAASRTGVDDIREILDGVRYAPTSARYKIYIIDEVHMLSKNAFNALLKTLEEPPPHVKFIFATTEIRKVPVTVLSRCQRFDLRRVDAPTLAAHYTKICGLENAAAEDEAVAMVARAADGSVRDGLSLLDQAIALGGGTVSAQLVKDMLGLVDRARTLDLLEKALTGNTAEALAVMEDLYRGGADPAVVIEDLLDYTHILTRLRAVPGMKDTAGTMAADTFEAAATLAGKLSMPSLGRAWQILLKGLAEVSAAPNPQAAAEMVVIRLSYAADLPDPADLLKKLKNQPQGIAAQPPSHGAPMEPAPVARAASGGGEYAHYGMAAPAPEPQGAPLEQIRSLQDIVALLDARREVLLAGQVFHMVHLVKLAEGRLEIRPDEVAPSDLAQRLGQVLSKITGARWIVSVSSAAGAPTLAEVEQAEKAALLEKIKASTPVACILELFPGAEIVRILDEND